MPREQPALGLQSALLELPAKQARCGETISKSLLYSGQQRPIPASMQTLVPLVCGYVAHVEHVGGTGRYGRASVAWVARIGQPQEACQAVNAQFLLRVASGGFNLCGPVFLAHFVCPA